MTISIERLTTLHTLSSCARLQHKITDTTIITTPLLVTLQRSGGLILGSYDTDLEPPLLCGTLVDLRGRNQRVPSWHTVFHGVKGAFRNRGIGYRLRLRERREGRKEGVALITWTIDPLRSLEPHLAFNKLAAIAFSYERNLYGDLKDRMNRGLATDRLIVEWWIDSPRVVSVLDRGDLPHHFHLGLNQMEVVTKTKPVVDGIRRLLDFEPSPKSRVILVEIPVDLDRMREYDLSLARDWRLRTRDLFEQLFANGYTMTGFVHEAGRSFHLLERADKKTVLGRTT
jgi:predicted GNAT superfamily acetyltransferase